MRKKILLVLRYAFFLALGIVLVWFPIHKVTPEQWVQIKSALKQARYLLLIPICLLYEASIWAVRLIELRRKMAAERVERLPKDIDAFSELRRKCARWAK